MPSVEDPQSKALRKAVMKVDEKRRELSRAQQALIRAQRELDELFDKLEQAHVRKQKRRWKPKSLS